MRSGCWAGVWSDESPESFGAIKDLRHREVGVGEAAHGAKYCASVMESSLPPKSERPVSVRKPLRQLSLGRGQDLSPASPLISTRNLVPGVSESVVKLDKLGKGEIQNPEANLPV